MDSEDLRGDVLLKAHKVINGERQDTYGTPEDSFRMIADQWRWYLKRQYDTDIVLKAYDVAMMMVLFKICRMFGQEYSEDNYVDACGYLALAGDMYEQTLAEIERKATIKAQDTRCEEISNVSK